VAFGLRVKPRRERPTEAEIHRRVHELLELVQLDWLAHRYPPQLSGGQRQRIALARALAVRPSVLLLDEPFGALDAKVRKDLRRWIRQLHDEIHVTSVFVTHDQEEALEVADRIVVLNHGRVEQEGTPAEVYDRPATPFVYHFLGDVNLFHGRVDSGRVFVGDTEFAVDEHRHVRDAEAHIYVRPHELHLTRKANGKDQIKAIVREVRPLGALVRVALERCDDGGLIEAHLPRNGFADGEIVPGELVYVEAQNPRVFLAPSAAAG
jgi:sulfate transport system ATP-binding protein